MKIKYILSFIVILFSSFIVLSLVLINYEMNQRKIFNSSIIRTSCNVFFCNLTYIVYGIHGVTKSEKYTLNNCIPDVIRCYYIDGDINNTLTLNKIEYSPILNMAALVIFLVLSISVTIFLFLYLLSSWRNLDVEKIPLLENNIAKLNI